MPPNQSIHDEGSSFSLLVETNEHQLRCAILGCGMMGQEHCSYIMGYPTELRIDYLCDPHKPSINECLKIISSSPAPSLSGSSPQMLNDEEELFQYAASIDVLVIATPNYLHTDTLLRWMDQDVTILLEKPVGVSKQQHDRLLQAAENGSIRARVWVAMEYRYIPAIAKLIELLPTVGDIKMVTIRENRYPFLHKIGSWNRDKDKTGDTLVEKCCHFFDLMRLITGQEAQLGNVQAIAQRGLNYDTEPDDHPVPIIDSAYVVMPFRPQSTPAKHGSATSTRTMGCLELCMYAEGSRHQEEVIVTGTKGRLEAYLPENKVYKYERPSHELWEDRHVPPPPSAIKKFVYDCSNVKSVHGIEGEIPTHGGYHYSSTAIEWYKLLGAIRGYETTSEWHPEVSILDGLRAVEIGLKATQVVHNQETF